MEFKNKVVIVTGSGQGIGRAIALKYAEQQASIVIADRNRLLADETAALVEKAGARSLTLEVDVTDFASVEQMLETTVNTFGTVDILVNNVGLDVVQSFFDNSIGLWNRLLDVNLKGCLYCCRVIGEYMKENKQGRIVNISSDAGRVGSGVEAVYATAKGGVIAFTKSLAAALGPYNITVNSVSPGVTNTPAVQKGVAMSKEIAHEIKLREEASVFKRAAEAGEIADAVLFFSSDTSKYITGQILSVNGGSLMVD